MRKSARVSKKLVSPGLPGLKVATRLIDLSSVPRIPADNTYLLLAECEVRTASYGPSFYLPFMAQARSAWAMKTKKEKTRMHNLPYGPSKRG